MEIGNNIRKKRQGYRKIILRILFVDKKEKKKGISGNWNVTVLFFSKENSLTEYQPRTEREKERETLLLLAAINPD